MRTEELSIQQKIWRSAGVLWWGIKPAALYLFFPPMLMCVGMVLFGGRSAGEVLKDSGNFYYTLGIILTIVLLHRKSKKRGSTLCRETGIELKNLKWKRMAMLGAMGMGFALFFSAVITAVPFPAGLMEAYHSSQEGFKNNTDQMLVLVSTVLFAPVAEEIVFRGYMLGRFLTWFKEREAMVLTAAIFAICHVSLLWILYACFMGLLLAWVSIREDNSIYSIALHIGFNLSVILVAGINSRPALQELMLGSRFRVLLFGGVCLMLALGVLGRYRRENIV